MKINNIINSKNKPVICIEEDKLFYSIADAAAHYSINNTCVSKVLAGKYSHAGHHTFRYATEEEIMRAVKDVTIQEEASTTANGTRTNGNCEPCMCITDGMYFASMVDAAEHYGVAPSQISKACSTGGKAAGHIFCTQIPMYSKVFLFLSQSVIKNSPSFATIMSVKHI